MTLHVFAVDAGRHELRGGDDDWVALLGVDEVVELRLALGVVAGDAHDVLAVLGAEVAFALTSASRIRSAWSMSSQKTMVLSYRSVSVRNCVTFFATKLRALLQHERAVEVALVVDAVLDLLAELVALALLGAPAGEVLVEVDADDLVGREEAVLDPLLERVRVDRLAEVVRGRDIGRLLRRRRETDLRRAEK
jgi:hypothetical protein